VGEQPAITVIGATGVVGRLVARELARQDRPFRLTGRDADRLAALVEPLGADVETRIVDVRDADSLSAAIQPGDAVINCAGPFTELGDPVVRTCLDARAHYLDTTGEQTFMRRVVERYDEQARAAGVSVVPAMAFEYALADCAAALGGRGLAKPLRSVDAIYSWRTPVSSRGTRRSVVRMLGRRGVVLEGGRLRSSAQGARRRSVLLSAGRPRHAVMFTSGEVITVPRHLATAAVRGWVVVGAGSARLVPLLSPFLPVIVPLLRPLIEAMATRAPDPTEAARAASDFTIRVELHDRTGIRRATELRGRDPYMITAAAAVAGARRALATDAPRGVLAPAQLVEPRQFLADLARVGLRVVDNF
jgi:short subunit dehydrogenase-like uncharacterized protein